MNLFLLHVVVGFTLLLLIIPITEAQSTVSRDTAGTVNAALHGKVIPQLEQISDAQKKMREDLNELFSCSSRRPTLEDEAGENMPHDCGELYRAGYDQSGVYTVYISIARFSMPISVYCDMETDRGGWMVFQRRQDGTVDFYRNWEDYSKGFGYISGEFWLGNELLHLLTDQKHQELRVDMHDHEGLTAYATYDHFYVGPQTDNFILNVSGYTGNAGDSLSYHNNQMFSTKDRDNDSGSRHCARIRYGAWWYGDCHHSNLNGLYAQTGSHNMTDRGNYVNWYRWRGYDYSLKFTEMKIRPYDF